MKKTYSNETRVWVLIAALLPGAWQAAAWQTQTPQPGPTGPDTIPLNYGSKYLTADSSHCGSAIAQNLWGAANPTTHLWSTFALTGDLPLKPLPQMQPLVTFTCSTSGKEKQKPIAILLYGALWRIGADGNWSQASGQLQVYRAVSVTTHGVELLADGYHKPGAAPKGDVNPKPGEPKAMPKMEGWAPKSALYNDKVAKFIGVSCFYDWDGANLEDVTRINGVALTYKIGTTPVTPDNVTNLAVVLGGLFPAGAKAALLAPPPPLANTITLSPASSTLVPGERVRLRATANGAPVPPQQLTFTVTLGGTTVKSAIDKYGTFMVPAAAQPGDRFEITAKASGLADGHAVVAVPKLLPCLISAGDVVVSSLPSDITITVNVTDSSKTPPTKPVPLDASTAEAMSDAGVGMPLPALGARISAVAYRPLSPGPLLPQVAAQGSPGGTPGNNTGNNGGNSPGCSSVTSTPCSYSRTIRAYDREWWDVGMGLSIPGVLEPQYASAPPFGHLNPTRHTDVYGFANLFPFAALGNKTSYYPSFIAGIPVTGQVFYRPFFGMAENITGWLGKSFPIQVNVIAGMVFMNQEAVGLNGQGVLGVQHSRIWKPMFGIEVPVSALASKIVGLGGGGSKSQTGGGGKSAGGSQN